MGVCIQKRSKIHPLTPESKFIRRKGLDKEIEGERKEFLLKLEDSLVKEFLSEVDKKIKRENPLSSEELEEFLRLLYKNLRRKFFDQIFRCEAFERISYEIIYLKLEDVIKKCQGAELEFRFANDDYSYEFCYRLKQEMIEKMIEGVSKVDTLAEFENRVRGSFSMEGIHEMHQLVEMVGKDNALAKIELNKENKRAEKEVFELIKSNCGEENTTPDEGDLHITNF